MLEGFTGEAPRGDDFDVGFEAVEGELKADLVVALARASMGHKTEWWVRMARAWRVR